MTKLNYAATFGLAVALAAPAMWAAEVHKEARLDIAPGGSVNIFNNGGSVNLHSDAGKQVVVVYTMHSDKVEVDQTTTADKRRAEFRTHVIADQKPSPEEARVDYDVSVPKGVGVTVSGATATIVADNMSSDLTLSTDTGQVTVRNVYRSHITVHSVAAPVTLSNITNGTVDVTTSTGTVEMTSVFGPKVKAGTTSGNITYRGDCAGGGEYSFATHSGAIDVLMPETASVDLSAHTETGILQTDFAFKAKDHNYFTNKQGSSFSGTSNSGLSSLELRSFSGKIRVKKQ